MIDKGILEDLGRRVLNELGLHRWRVFYADAEPETLVDKQPAPNSAANIRFHLHADNGELTHIIRFRIARNALTTPSQRDAEICGQLQAGLRRAHFDSSTH